MSNTSQSWSVAGALSKRRFVQRGMCEWMCLLTCYVNTQHETQVRSLTFQELTHFAPPSWLSVTASRMRYDESSPDGPFRKFASETVKNGVFCACVWCLCNSLSHFRGCHCSLAPCVPVEQLLQVLRRQFCDDWLRQQHSTTTINASPVVSMNPRDMCN